METIRFTADQIRFATHLIESKASRNLMDITVLPDTQLMIQTLAGLVQGTEAKLGEEDFFYLLTKPELYNNNPETERLLRIALNLPEKNPHDIHLFFQMVDCGESVAAITRISPIQQPIEGPPILFIGGLHHKHQVYLATMMEVAKQSGREIILMDTPGMGASSLKGNSASAQILLDSVLAVIKQEFVSGDSIVIAGHSLGTIIPRALYNQIDDFETQSKIKVDRVILDAPVPSERERAMGYALNGNFAKGMIYGQLVLNGGDIAPLLLPLFFNEHDMDDREGLEKIISRESFSTNIFEALKIFMQAYSTPLLHKIGQDPRLQIIFHHKDRLMHLENLKEWEGKRGVHFSPGDHSEAAGFKPNQDYVETFLHALNGDSDAERVNPQTLYRRTKNMSSLGIRGDSRGKLSVELGLDLQHGLVALPAAGLDVFLHTGLTAGHQIGKREIFDAQLQGGLAVKFLDLPLSARLGGEVSLSILDGTFDLNLLQSIILNLEDAVKLELGVTYGESFTGFVGLGIPIP